MIDARELRLNNLVEYLGETKTVLGFDEETVYLKNTVSVYYIELDEIYPIPLTEEWLLRFGFNIRDKTYYLNYGGESKRYAYLEFEKNTFVLYFHGKHGFNTNDGRKSGDHCILFVHQLQNLYFTLTNKELVLQE